MQKILLNYSQYRINKNLIIYTKNQVIKKIIYKNKKKAVSLKNQIKQLNMIIIYLMMLYGYKIMMQRK